MHLAVEARCRRVVFHVSCAAFNLGGSWPAYFSGSLILVLSGGMRAYVLAAPRGPCWPQGSLSNACGADQPLRVARSPFFGLGSSEGK